MTVAALRRLLEEIDTQGGPEAARSGHLRLADTEGVPTAMTTALATAQAHPPIPQPLITVRTPATDTEPERLPVGQLLAWGDQHNDPDIQDQAARARAALVGLRQRYVADRELTALENEEEQLARRLEEIRTRKGELAPAKPKKKTQRDYEPAEVRAWAKANSVDCPAHGRVPKAVVDAWRATQTHTEQQSTPA
ncbi:histone-like nucleoid-structuring protein Lsr2 [Streptomyces sp. NBC_01171]|uniref:Lsr2 family DNA-binding protein n=1 Tax=Streptomyces sp. NBC_01171 TaxID=2903757 RepID=UPI0038675596|nr:Lsr2 family protein [Streptomyces sp. NBC_01171]